MKARLEEAILGTIGARQEMVRRSRGELTVESRAAVPVCKPGARGMEAGNQFRARPQM